MGGIGCVPPEEILLFVRNGNVLNQNVTTPCQVNTTYVACTAKVHAHMEGRLIELESRLSPLTALIIVGVENSTAISVHMPGLQLTRCVVLLHNFRTILSLRFYTFMMFKYLYLY